MPGYELASVLFATLAGASLVIALLLGMTHIFGKGKGGPK